MKNLLTLSTFCFLLLTMVQGQAPPEAFNYSGAARDAQGNPISEKTIGVEFSILKGSPTGAVQYRERHFVNTDKFGVFNCTVGQGSVQQGTFSDVNWSNDSYYLRVGLDAGGGTNFVVLGTTQLLSVPYALYAKSSGNASSGYTHYIGEYYDGGVIFNLWKDSTGAERGLIVALNDQGVNQSWSNVIVNEIGVSAQSTWNGINNSISIVNQPGHTTSAAKLCLDLNINGQSDWYLPSIDELSLLWQNRFLVNKSLSTINGASQISLGTYWSSTESSSYSAYIFYFLRGNAEPQGDKWNNASYVRAIRAF